MVMMFLSTGGVAQDPGAHWALGLQRAVAPAPLQFQSWFGCWTHDLASSRLEPLSHDKVDAAAGGAKSVPSPFSKQT